MTINAPVKKPPLEQRIITYATPTSPPRYHGRVKKPNFPLAFFLAILAGGLAAFLTALVILGLMGTEGEKTLKGALTAASLIGWYATFISTCYVLIIGLAVVIYVRTAHRVPSLATALMVGLVTGVLPFVAPPVLQYIRNTSPSKFDLFLMPALAIASSLAVAWTFWRVGLRGRVPA